MRADVGRSWRLLAASILAVLVVAVAIVIVQEPRVPAQASPPKPAAAGGAVPVAMAPATGRPSSPPKSPAPGVVSGVNTATHLSAGWGGGIPWPPIGPRGMAPASP